MPKTDGVRCAEVAQGLSRVTHLVNYETVKERSGSWEDEKELRQKLKASSKTEETQKARQLLRDQAQAQREKKTKERSLLAFQGKSKEEVQVMKVMDSMIDKLEKSADQEERMADLAARKAVRVSPPCVQPDSCVLLLRATALDSQTSVTAQNEARANVGVAQLQLAAFS